MSTPATPSDQGFTRQGRWWVVTATGRKYSSSSLAREAAAKVAAQPEQAPRKNGEA
jgi:hypothetical protein